MLSKHTCSSQDAATITKTAAKTQPTCAGLQQLIARVHRQHCLNRPQQPTPKPQETTHLRWFVAAGRPPAWAALPQKPPSRRPPARPASARSAGPWCLRAPSSRSPPPSPGQPWTAAQPPPPWPHRRPTRPPRRLVESPSTPHGRSCRGGCPGPSETACPRAWGGTPRACIHSKGAADHPAVDPASTPPPLPSPTRSLAPGSFSPPYLATPPHVSAPVLEILAIEERCVLKARAEDRLVARSDRGHIHRPIGDGHKRWQQLSASFRVRVDWEVALVLSHDHDQNLLRQRQEGRIKGARHDRGAFHQVGHLGAHGQARVNGGRGQGAWGEKRGGKRR
eukprot:366569-Chlamydomonas_euryale.AAC.45